MLQIRGFSLASHLNAELQRRIGLVKLLSVTLGVGALVFGSYYAVNLVLNLTNNISTNTNGYTFMSVSCFISAVSFFGATYLVSSKTINRARVDLAIYVMFLSLLLIVTVCQVLLGTNDSTPSSYLLAPLLVAVTGLNGREVAICTFITALMLATMYIIDQILDLYNPILLIGTPLHISTWLTILFILAVGLSNFTSRLSRAAVELEQQTAKLSNLLNALNATTQFGALLGNELSRITADLNNASRQQTSSTQEQVAAITQVTSSLEELNETANQIATAANSAATSANKTLDLATEVKTASKLAMATASEGNQAVELALGSVEQVRNRIELLGQRLLNLTEQTRKVASIIEIIDEIADETHLLALNASIEAAGGTSQASEQTIGSVRLGGRGERFGVIAQEVKNLSDRSRESTEEVRQAISEMQGAVAGAVLVAEEGKKETSAALTRSQIAGSVIDKLNDVISNSALQADAILTAVEEVNGRCDEISLATSQQRSANQQILSTMRMVSQVASENVESVSQISESVSQVNNRVDELNGVLANSAYISEADNS